MAAKYWLKMYHEALYDPKLASLADNLWRRFWELCLMAGELDEDGFLPDVDDMAWTVRTGTDALRSELGQLAMRGMVELAEDDEGRERWFVSNFAKRQAPSSDAKRMREYRKRKKREHEKKENTPHTPQKKERDKEADTDTYRRVTPVTHALHNVTASELDAAAAAFTDVFGAPSIGGDQWVTKWQPTLESMLREHDGDIDAIRATFEAAYTVWDKRRKPAGGHYPANSPGAVAWAIAEVLRKEREPVATPTLAQRINDAWRDHGPAFDRWPADLRDAAAAQDWRDHNLAIFNIVQAVRS